METVSDIATPVPFFEDRRTIVEKLNCDKRQWAPHKETDCPAQIFGLILELGTYFSDFKDDQGNSRMHPTARVLTHENIEWSVIAFAGYLKSEFERKNPRVGDFAAFAFSGVKPSKKAGENDAYVFVLEVERNPDPTSAATLVSSQVLAEQAAGEEYVEALVDQDIEDELEEAAEKDEGDDGIPF